MVIHLGVHVNGLRAAEHESVYHAAVYVSGQDYLIPRLARGENHALHRRGSPAHHEVGVSRSECVRRQLLRLVNYRDGVAEVIKGLHRIYVQPDAPFAQQLHELGISAPALMPGNVEGHDPLLSEPFKRLVNGRGSLSFYIHLTHTPNKKQVSHDTRK